MALRIEPEKPKVRGRLSVFLGMSSSPADKREMESNPRLSIWERGDSAGVRLVKLVGALGEAQERTELVRRIVLAAQSIERARQENEISDEGAARFTDYLVSFAAMQPSFEQASSTINDYLLRYLIPATPWPAK